MDPFRVMHPLGLKSRGVIQVGANSGQEAALFSKYGVEAAIMIEALPDLMGRLTGNLAAFEKYLPVLALCTDKDGEDHTYYRASNSGASSSILAPGTVSVLHPEVKFEAGQVLRSRRLDTVIDELLAERTDLTAEQFDMLYLDTQGSEMLVMRGAPRTISNKKYIWTEISNTRLYKDQPVFKDIIYFLDELGFDLCFSSVNHWGWGDALFVHRQAVPWSAAGVG